MGYELCASLEKIHGGKGKSPFHIEKGLTTKLVLTFILLFLWTSFYKKARSFSTS